MGEGGCGERGWPVGCLVEFSHPTAKLTFPVVCHRLGLPYLGHHMELIKINKWRPQGGLWRPAVCDLLINRGAVAPAVGSGTDNSEKFRDGSFGGKLPGDARKASKVANVMKAAGAPPRRASILILAAAALVWGHKG